MNSAIETTSPHHISQTNDSAADVPLDQRFAFGKNWLNFSRSLTEEKVQESVDQLAEWLEVSNLKGKRFLDIGCGSVFPAWRPIAWEPASIASILTPIVSRVLRAYGPIGPKRPLIGRLSALQLSTSLTSIHSASSRSSTRGESCIIPAT
jgi:hypothetical protein